MRSHRERRRDEGLQEINLWVTADQKAFLRRLSEDMGVSMSEAAQLLIFKTSKHLEVGILQVNDKR